MKHVAAAVAALLPFAAPAQQSTAPRDDRGFHARVHERYCEKLREGPEAYVQFVRRLKTVYGYTYSDFAPEHRGAPVVADCGIAPERVAAVQRALGKDSR